MRTNVISRTERFTAAALSQAIHEITGPKLQSLDQWIDACYTVRDRFRLMSVSFVVTDQWTKDCTIYTLNAYFH